MCILSVILHALYFDLSFLITGFDYALITGEWDMFWGIKKYNRVIKRSGMKGSVVDWEVIYSYKNGSIHNGTVEPPYIPLAIYFNGYPCSMPATRTLLKA